MAKKKRKLSPYNRFVRTQRKKGLSMKQIGRLWRSKGKTKKRTVRRAVRKTTRRRTTMPKRKTYRRRRSNPMGSYSKSNIATGTVLAQLVPKFLPQSSAWLPLAGLIPKAPTSIKVASWILASKIVSDRFVGK